MWKAPSTSKPSAIPDFFSPQVGKARRFYLDLNPPKRRPLAVVSGGLEYCAPDYSICRDTFPYFCIEYVLRGKGEVTLGRRRYPLAAGRLFAYGPGINHEISTDPDEPLVKYFVDFAGSQATALLKSCRLAAGRIARVHPADSLSPLYDELIESGLHIAPKSADLCTQLLECLALKAAARTAPIMAAESRAFVTYQKCLGHVEQHFLRLRTLEQIATECRMNGAYLCRLFKRFSRQSPYQYLLRLKMNHAAAQLQKSGTLVKDVATIVGFDDALHFSRVFRNVLGTSPTEFRELH
ncbi:MAG: AraC family transcriptional regulator [Rhizomicrobium sp.]|jgi:AraC-like DNA-binding protein